MKRALICGITGQDGTYLARFLLDKGYCVYGSSRDIGLANLTGLDTLGILDHVSLASIDCLDLGSMSSMLTEIQPDEIYNLGGQSSVGLSFEQPVEALSSIGLATTTLLEATRRSGLRPRIYNAGSGELFGGKPDPSNETTPFDPRSPYAVAKAAAYWTVRNYRQAYNLFACTGLMFNHESPLRPDQFVTKKIVRAAVRIARGGKDRLVLGNIDIARDWGWAPEYVTAMWRMLQHEEALDLVIATGRSSTLREFVDHAFKLVGLDWREHVVTDSRLMRPLDLATSLGDPSKAAKSIDWKPSFFLEDVVERMIKAELGKQAGDGGA